MRRLFEHQGFEVSRLSRIRYGTVRLPNDLKACGYKRLESVAAAELQRLASVEQRR